MRHSAALALVALALGACPSARPHVRRSPPAEAPVRGGTLRIALSEDVDFLDPQRAGLPAALALMRAMHRGLMAFPSASDQVAPSPEAGAGSSATPVPDLASGPPVISADARTYTFTLRDDVEFGPPASRAVHAGDVVAGIRRLLARGSVSPFTTYFHVIRGADAFSSGHSQDLPGVLAPDDRTVVVTFARPTNDALWILALPSASAIPAEMEGRARPDPASISPAGPYMLAGRDGYVPEESIHLVRNPAWRASADPVRPAYVDDIRVRIASSPADVRARLGSGADDLSLDTPPDLAAVQRDPVLRARVHAVPGGCLRYLWMNVRVPPLTSVALRRTIAASVDRAAVLRAEGGGLAGVTTAWPITRTVLGADPDAAPSVYGSPIRATPAPKVRAVVPLVVGDRESDRAEARAVVSSLRLAGVDVHVKSLPIADLYINAYEIPSRRIAMGIATWCADWPGLAGRGALQPLVDGRFILNMGNQDYSMVDDSRLEKLLDAAAVSDGGGAAQAWRAVARRVVELAPWAPLVDLNEVSLVSPRLGSAGATDAFPRGDPAGAWLRP